MITAEPVSDRALRLTPAGKLSAADFHALASVVDGMIERNGSIRLLIDASGFAGWDSLVALETHGGFIRSHQRHVERLAVIVGHDWQRWLVDAARLVLHPEARAFGKSGEREALDWIRAP
jgi:hypothetical protein